MTYDEHHVDFGCVMVCARHNKHKHTYSLSTTTATFGAGDQEACVSPMSSSRVPEPLSPGIIQTTDPVREDWPQTTMFPFQSSNTKTARDPVRTILVFAAVVSPLAILPYVLVRRHLAGLRTELTALRTANTKNTKELQRIKWDVDNGLEAARRHVDATFEREGTKIGKMLQQAERGAQERHDMRRAWEDEMRKSMGVLLSENMTRR